MDTWGYFLKHKWDKGHKIQLGNQGDVIYDWPSVSIYVNTQNINTFKKFVSNGRDIVVNTLEKKEF